MENLTKYWKGILAFVTPGVVALVAAVTETSQGGANITGPEWVGIGAAMVITGSVVTFGPSNKDRLENK